MKGFDPRTSFGHETSRDYDAVSKRGDEEETVAFLAGLAGGGAALELAVGTGRIALPLMKAGVRVDGIELSKDMVDRMREKPGGDQVEVVMGDMSRVTTGRSYGLVYLVFNTIGNLLTQDDQVRCFENAARHLTDDGVFVVECRVPTAPARPGHQFIDVERLELDHVELGVSRYDPLTQILDVNHVHLGADGLGFSPIRLRRPAAARPVGRVERRAVHRRQLAPHQRLRAHARPVTNRRLAVRNTLRGYSIGRPRLGRRQLPGYVGDKDEMLARLVRA